MLRIETLNRRIVLAARPQAAPTLGDFRLEEMPVPVPADGQMLLRTVWLSLDPYMRGRMNDAPSYAPPVALGETMVGGTVSRVAASRLAGFAPGDLVLSMNGWQDYALSDGAGVTRLPADAAHPSRYLGVLGMPGFTAYMGLLDIGQPRPGETVAVAAATGAVGSAVGQIAKIKGARAVGIAGGADKCRHAVETLGFDACLDHRSPTFAADLAAACPSGIDVYFENVGGSIFRAVLPLLNTHARVPVCGLIAQYNADSAPEGPDFAPLLMRAVLTRRLRLQGFIITLDYPDRIDEFVTAMTGWVEAGRVKALEDMVEGLENAPQALIGLLEGRNFGKVVVRVSR
ncbi:MAG TPA: NADP-dependent oxidoreductase [Stellaceae bacterium]|nr:NADP-dependent oxidoreductase [Stellaceae bacterium]